MTEELKNKLTERFDEITAGECDNKDLRDALLKAYLAGGEYGYQYAQQHPNWISVEERLPELVYPVGAEIKNTSDYVLAYNGYTMYISRFDGGKIKWWEDNSVLTTTHWMPLPPAPRKEE